VRGRLPEGGLSSGGQREDYYSGGTLPSEEYLFRIITRGKGNSFLGEVEERGKRSSSVRKGGAFLLTFILQKKRSRRGPLQKKW